MFLRPAVVSMDRLYRGVAHDPNKAAIGAKTAMLALASVGLYLLNRDDPRYQDLPDWDRDANLGISSSAISTSSYPKSGKIGAVASVAERTTERLMQDDPAGLGKDFARIVGNTFSLNYMPQIVAPMAEQATNRNPFTKAPIETPGMENVQPFLRAKPNTSETMKALGMATRDLPKSLQVQPARAEALLRGYLNTWGMYGLMLSDRVFFGDKLPRCAPTKCRWSVASTPTSRRSTPNSKRSFTTCWARPSACREPCANWIARAAPTSPTRKSRARWPARRSPWSGRTENLQQINAEMKGVRRDQDLDAGREAPASGWADR